MQTPRNTYLFIWPCNNVRVAPLAAAGLRENWERMRKWRGNGKRICWSQAPVCQVCVPSIGQLKSLQRSGSQAPCCVEALLLGVSVVGFIAGSKWGGCGLMAIIQSSGVLPGKEGKRRQISCQSTRPGPPHIPSLSLPLPLTTNEWPNRTYFCPFCVNESPWGMQTSADKMGCQPHFQYMGFDNRKVHSIWWDL